MASSIASFVPDPIEKWAVCAESPSRAVGTTSEPESIHVFVLSVGKLIHFDWLLINELPRRSSAKSSLAVGDALGLRRLVEPCVAPVSSLHSTMKVLVVPSNGYACTWNKSVVVRTKDEGEAVEGEGRAEPDVARSALCDARSENARPVLPRSAVDPVGRDHEVAVAEFLGHHLGLEPHVNSDWQCSDR